MDKETIKQNRIDALQNNLIEGLSPSKAALDFFIALDDITTDSDERIKLFIDEFKKNPDKYLSDK
tara:strand:+ start:447 stop:641 length:195 start_codon:yes stop_codon:yes gene_type:complete